jgi:hypothetical protein
MRSAIILGTLIEFPQSTLDQALEIRKYYDGKEAFAIRTEAQGDAGRLLLIGATDKGVPHAAFRFLERIGFRHFFPAPEWEVVPSIPTLKVDINETRRPAIWTRSIWYGYGLFADKGVPQEQWRSRLDSAAWVRHNFLGSSFSVRSGHAWQAIIADNKAVFQEHPEYLALVKQKDGTMARSGPQLCVSNAGLRQVVVQYARDYFKAHPGDEMVSVEPADGDRACQCDECKALGTVSEQAFYLANEVARVVGKEFPGKMVGLYAYNWHAEPPSFDLEPNVYVQLTAGMTVGRYTWEELFDLWPKKTSNLGFYDYYSVWAWDKDRLPGGRAANISYLHKQISGYAARHTTSISAESGNNWGPHGRGYYIASRLMWDPQAYVDALLMDFYEKSFGPGAEAMKRYYERLDPGNDPLISSPLLALAFRDVDEASRLTLDRPDIQARLNHIKQYLHYVHLRWMFDREKDKSKRRDLALAALTHVYRTRYSYMNHWEAMRQSWVSEAVKEFDEPTWSRADASPKPWVVETPVTPQETETDFHQGLEYFQPQAVTAINYSNDLVPVVFDDKNDVANRQHFQGPLRYALYSLNGEPLELDVVTGTIAWYRNRPDASYTLFSADEKALDKGRLPLDGQAHKLQFKVLGPGLYYFDFEDSKAGWRFASAPKSIVTLPLRKANGYAHQGQMQPLYFYVPKGIREIQYYWSGGSHKVVDPNGKEAMEVTANGDYVTVPVPDGMDGKVWSFTQLTLGRMWFFNIPNYLAVAPNSLLVPREVAVQDGLTLRN